MPFKSLVLFFSLPVLALPCFFFFTLHPPVVSPLTRQRRLLLCRERALEKPNWRWSVRTCFISFMFLPWDQHHDPYIMRPFLSFIPPTDQSILNPPCPHQISGWQPLLSLKLLHAGWWFISYEWMAWKKVHSSELWDKAAGFMWGIGVLYPRSTQENVIDHVIESKGTVRGSRRKTRTRKTSTRWNGAQEDDVQRSADKGGIEADVEVKGQNAELISAVMI